METIILTVLVGITCLCSGFALGCVFTIFAR